MGALRRNGTGSDEKASVSHRLYSPNWLSGSDGFQVADVTANLCPLLPQDGDDILAHPRNLGAAVAFLVAFAP
jgi:hypothetical protein